MKGEGASDDALVWYAAYGSNLDTARFHCYLAGGRPPGASRTYAPCPDGRTFLDSRPVRLDRRLFFGQRSATWDGGGVAFVEHERQAEPRTYGRAYLLTVTQLWHVARQENRLTTPTGPLTTGDLGGADPIALAIPPDRFYGVLLPVGLLDGRSMVTLTGAAARGPTNRPSPAYRETIARGLLDTWPELTPAEVETYLTAAGAA